MRSSSRSTTRPHPRPAALSRPRPGRRAVRSLRRGAVSYRAGDGGHKAPGKRVVVGRYGRVTPDQARRLAQELLGRVAGGGDPAGKGAEARALPTLGEACDDYIESGRGRAAETQRSYRRYATLYLGDWPFRPLDGITRRDIENRFHLITERHGAVPANQTLSFLRSVYRLPCVGHDGLRKRCPRDGARVPKYTATHTAGGIAPRSPG